jgi:hypothetical protein
MIAKTASLHSPLQSLARLRHILLGFSLILVMCTILCLTLYSQSFYFIPTAAFSHFSLYWMYIPSILMIFLGSNYLLTRLHTLHYSTALIYSYSITLVLSLLGYRLFFFDAPYWISQILPGHAIERRVKIKAIQAEKLTFEWHSPTDLKTFKITRAAFIKTLQPNQSITLIGKTTWMGTQVQGIKNDQTGEILKPASYLAQS